MNTWEHMLSLVGCEMGFCPLCDKTREALLLEDNIKQIAALAKKHDILPIVADAVIKACPELKASSPALYSSLWRELTLALYRYEKLKNELDKIKEALSLEKVCHMPLKGAVIRDKYPEPWLRTSCDIDLLVKPEELARAKDTLTDRLSYKADRKGPHDIPLSSPSGVHIELHYWLIEERAGEASSKILENVWNYSHVLDGFTYEMSDEMFYFYHIAHMAKHFQNGGCGVRPFIDLYLLLSDNNAPDAEDKRRELLEKGGLLRFETVCREVANMWFQGGEPSEIAKKTSDYILCGGVYGTMENYVANHNAKADGKFSYLMRRLFRPYKELCEDYPMIIKHKWLTPFFELVRFFRMIFGGRLKRSLSEVSMVVSSDKEKLNNTRRFLEELGL